MILWLVLLFSQKLLHHIQKKNKSDFVKLSVYYLQLVVFFFFFATCGF